MLYRLLRFLARLRSRQPALFILPGIILSQILVVPLGSDLLGILILLLFILTLIVMLVKGENLLSLYTGLALGCLSMVSLPNEFIQTKGFESKVVARILPQGLRFPKPGLMQFGIFIMRPYQIEAENSKLVTKMVGSRFQCRAVSLPWKNIAEVKAGDWVILDASFNLFRRNLWPWDYDAQLSRRGYLGTCKLKYLMRLGFSKATSLDKLRDRLLLPYYRTVGNDEVSAMLLSLSFGIRDVISASSERVFKDLGISHVLVLSGMQIGLIFFGVAFLLRKFLRAFCCMSPAFIVAVSYICASAVSALLVHLTYYEASATRAWIACVLVALASSAEKETGIVRGSIASFVVLSLIWPGCWAEAGVQLSFAALFGIAIGQDFAITKLEKLFIPCFFATAFTTVVSAAWFDTLSISALSSNLLLAPWFAVVGCYLGFILVVFCYLEIPFVDELAMFCRWFLDCCLKVVEWNHSYFPEPRSLIAGQSFLLVCVLIFFVGCYLYYKGQDWIREFNFLKCKHDSTELAEVGVSKTQRVTQKN